MKPRRRTSTDTTQSYYNGINNDNNNNNIMTVNNESSGDEWFSMQQHQQKRLRPQPQSSTTTSSSRQGASASSSQRGGDDASIASVGPVKCGPVGFILSLLMIPMILINLWPSTSLKNSAASSTTTTSIARSSTTGGYSNTGLKGTSYSIQQPGSQYNQYGASSANANTNTNQYNSYAAAAAGNTASSSNIAASSSSSSVGGNYNAPSSAQTAISAPSTTNNDNAPPIIFKTGDFTGEQTTWSSDRTISVKTVAETPFAKCDVHSVKSEDGGSVVEDWIFLEERNAINVLVQFPDGKYLVMKQGKYAIHGQTLSPVGGFINIGESPFDAARREVIEETGMSSEMTRQTLKQNLGGFNTPISYTEDGMPDGRTTMEETDWLFLGKYRTAANRGAGYTYCYLLKNAVDIVPKGGTKKFEGRGDDEEQFFLRLDPMQMAEALANGDFKEIKWTAVVAMSLLNQHNLLPPMGTTQIKGG